MTQHRAKEGQPVSIRARLRSKVRSRRPIRNTAIVLGLSLSASMAQASLPAAAHGQGNGLQELNAAACYQLVQNAGRQIAWARWEQGLSVEKTRSAELHDGTPAWASRLVKEWIEDAYAWHASDEQIRQWATELGSSDHLPSAEQLSVPEAIAIWMRRIGRQCQELSAHADASADLLRNELRLTR